MPALVLPLRVYAKTMRPSGQDTVTGILEWFKEELKNAPASRLDLGKFFFGISSASLGAIVAFKKLEESLVIDCWIGASLVVLGLSTLVAVLMVIPRVWIVTGDADLFEEHTRQVRHLTFFIWIWFGSWIVGSALGVYD